MTEPLRDPLLDPPAWAPSWLPTIDDVRGIRILRWLVGAVFVAGLAASVSAGADAPADPVVEVAPAPDTTGPAAGAAPLAERFGTVKARLVAASGEVLELCLLLADTVEERSQGLMQVTDLEGHDGMLFQNEAPSDAPFYMFRTLLPLTIAWWDEGGAFVSRTDMAPCDSEDPAACERYPPAAPYRLGLEVVQGSPLAERFGPGATLAATGEACAAPA